MLSSSRKYLLMYLVSRTATYFATVFSGVTLVYLIVRAMPVSIVEHMIFQLINTVGTVYDPRAINELRKEMYEIFGLGGKSPLEDYLIFLHRVFTFNFGPSFISYPTPAFEIVSRRLPWTIGLLSVTTIIVWITGNLLGTIAGYFRTRRFARVLESIAISLYPIPYYVIALILILLFVVFIPVFPLSGGVSVIGEALTLEVVLSIIRHSFLPAVSIILPGALGWSFLSSRTLALNILAEDYTKYAELRGLPGKHILRKYVFRNILVPQMTVLALSLGGIFTGALLTEVIFAYPGVGYLAYRAAFSGDINTLMAITLLSMLAVCTAVYVLDLLYPLIDPRIRHR